eukprot:6180371-Pleurochrysis_carterae.AAC.1
MYLFGCHRPASLRPFWWYLATPTSRCNLKSFQANEGFPPSPVERATPCSQRMFFFDLMLCAGETHAELRTTGPSLALPVCASGFMFALKYVRDGKRICDHTYVHMSGSVIAWAYVCLCKRVRVGL